MADPMSKILEEIHAEMQNRKQSANCKVCNILDNLDKAEAAEIDRLVRIRPRPAISYEKIATILRLHGHDTSEHGLRRHRDRCAPRPSILQP